MLKLVVNNPWGKIDYLQAEVDRTHAAYGESVLTATAAIMDAQDAFDAWSDAVKKQRYAEIMEKLCNEGRA